MEGFLTIGFICFCLSHNVAWAKNENAYFVVGKSLVLRPPSGAATLITSVQWRHGDTIAAEWENGGALEIWRNFKGRTDLNTTNGYLTISNMTEVEAGTYSVEINSKQLDDKYVVKSIEEVPKPKIWAKAVKAEDEHTFECEGNVERAEPVTYWWDIAEDRSYVQLGRTIDIKKNETTQRMETFSCKIVNPVSEKKSEPLPNPFYTKSGNSALGAIAILPIILLIVAGVVGYWKRAYIKQRFCPGTNDVRDGNGAVPQTEGVPLNEENAKQDIPA